MRVAGVLRRYMAMKGYTPTPPNAADPPVFSFIVYPAGESGFVSIRPEPADQVEDHVGAYLSQELRSPAWSLVFGDEVVAIRAYDGGKETARFGWVGGAVAEEHDADWAQAIATGQDPTEVLDGLGLTYFQGEDRPRRSLVAGFSHRARRGTPAFEVDPLLECPTCKGPMVKRTSKKGPFYGCVRFPQCDGILTEEQADQMRAEKAAP